MSYFFKILRLNVDIRFFYFMFLILNNAFASGYEANSSDRVSKLTHLVKEDCAACHGGLLKGGLGPALEKESLVMKSDDYLVKIILNGSPGTPMPPWSQFLTEDDAKWIVKWLRHH